ncbi:ankyrin repeat, SAM and basic leucine zipper domain-containing protein 1-like [Branchiostoma lanceolatum]|uniref:ankyrin repeat, SAM and basic leucine zipper domain-containing protein 1-like n=1 Tax=Branchiostoma lanceolatum TaxID=7740 RepID=UPI0034552D1E
MATDRRLIIMSNEQAKRLEPTTTKTRSSTQSSFLRGTASSSQKSGTRSQEQQLWDAICNDDLKKVHTILCTAQNLNLNKPYTVITIDKNQGRDTCSTTYLLQACKVCRSSEIARALIRAGANVDTSGNVLKKVPYGSTWVPDTVVGNVTPLILAVIMRSEDLVRCLIQLGANVNSTNEAGECPLHYVFTGMTQNPSHVTRKTPIARKDRNVTDTVFAALVESGADLNASNKQGFTALHVAAERGCLEEVQTLVKAGADINVQTPVTGLTPLSLAKHANNVAVVNYLIQHAEGKAKSEVKN